MESRPARGDLAPFPSTPNSCRHPSLVTQVLASDHAEQVGYEYNNVSSLLEAAAACEDDLAAVIVSAFDYRYSRQALIALDQTFDNITLGI